MPLLHLPNELLLLVASYLPVPDLASFLRTTTHLSHLLTPVLHRLAISDLEGCPALLWALRTAHEPLVRLLREKGVDANSQRQGVTQLLYAVIRLREPIIRMLLEEREVGGVGRLGEAIVGVLVGEGGR